MHHFRSFKIISSTPNIKSLSLIRSCCNFSGSSINLTTLCKTLGHQQILSTLSSSWFPGHLWTWWKAQFQQRSLEPYWLPPTIVRVKHIIFPFTFNFLFSIPELFLLPYFIFLEAFRLFQSLEISVCYITWITLVPLCDISNTNRFIRQNFPPQKHCQFTQSKLYAFGIY